MPHTRDAAKVVSLVISFCFLPFLTNFWATTSQEDSTSTNEFESNEYLLPVPFKMSETVQKPRNFKNVERRSISNDTALFDPQKERFRVPTYMIIGAQKSGTTSLSRSMRRHPLVNKVQKKELHFFDRGGKTRKDYLTPSQFPFPRGTSLSERTKWKKSNGPMLYGQRVTYDATPSYLFESNVVISNIKEVCPWVKFIVSLRNPVDRAYSSYAMQRRRWPEKYRTIDFDSFVRMDVEDMRKAGLLPRHSSHNSSLLEGNQNGYSLNYLDSGALTMPQEFYGSEEEDEAWIKYLAMKDPFVKGVVARGLYAVQLRQWFREFQRDKFLIFEYEQDLATAGGSAKSYERMVNFIGLPNESGYRRPRVNHGKYGSVEPMLNETRAALVELYRPHNAQLVALLSKEKEWKSTW